MSRKPEGLGVGNTPSLPGEANITLKPKPREDAMKKLQRTLSSTRKHSYQEFSKRNPTMYKKGNTAQSSALLGEGKADWVFVHRLN